MNVERLLAVVGVVIGIPGFLALFMSDRWIQGTLVLVVVIGLVAYLWYQRWHDSLPMITVLYLEKRLAINDVQGISATFSRLQRLKTNHPGLTDLWSGNIAADGTIANIRIDGKPPDEKRVDAGTIQVCKRFPYPLKRAESVESILSYELELVSKIGSASK